MYVLFYGIVVVRVYSTELVYKYNRIKYCFILFIK